ncbi:MAG TPA: 2-isopropylmalate synthase, partial [Paracoccaceae bacterium]|nr:2-isopropylmalate synthase [Paracoccaceae bacterium]
MPALLAGPAAAQPATTVQTKQYDTGDVYEGEFKDGKQHGTGTYRRPGGFEYTGDWVEGRIEGKGTAKYPNGSVYEGEFNNGAPHGT